MTAEVHSLDGNVIEIGEPSLADIPGMMRKIADKIERGELGELQCALFIPMQKDAHVPDSVYGWGSLSPIEMLGIMEAAKHRLLAGDS